MSGIWKEKVSTGVYWLQVPEARLSVLCGCPSDSVKHLMKKGFISTRTEGGTTFETGPNAILLSDVLIQNGRFSNLSEFPFLQMFYRQGMLLPGHPNNTGERPLLIGSEAQVRAQMSYLLRGNYGLLSTDELMMSGASAEEAQDLMRIKLRFAFGSILPTEDLVDAVVVRSDPVELRRGVSVRRKAVNIFEFQYRGDAVIIDLNMVPFEHYEAPYDLAPMRIELADFAVVHSGDGDGWDVDRPAMSSVLVHMGRIYLIDAGPNILYVLSALGLGVSEIEGLFHTHAHDDHFAGLVNLVRVGRSIRYYATPTVRASVAKKLSALISRDEEEFDRYFDTVDLVQDRWNDVNGLGVMPVFSPHPVETTVMYFRAAGQDGVRTYGHLADISSFEVLGGMVTKDRTAAGIGEDLAVKVRASYLLPADIKKIDIGGGLIHGQAEDFTGDRSGILYLSHIARELTAEERKIGRVAAFGQHDLLIPASADHWRKRAEGYLASHYAHAGRDGLEPLLACPVVSLKPGAMILAEGQMARDVFLILSGEVRAEGAAWGARRSLWAGSLVGDGSVLTGTTSRWTCRAAGHVSALKVPAEVYRKFLRKNRLWDEALELRERLEFLRSTPLFGDSVPHPVLHRVAKSMKPLDAAEGLIDPDSGDPGLYVLESGQAELYLGEDRIESLARGECFGEGRFLFSTPCLYRVRLAEGAAVHFIPSDALEKIPSVRWRLFEIYDRRMENMMNPEIVSVPIFQWRREYAIGIEAVDEDHRELFRIAGDLYQAITSGGRRDEVLRMIVSLIDYTASHFAREESMMREWRYPGYERHRGKHLGLMGDIEKARERYMQGTMDVDAEFVRFVKEWVIEHILNEDRRLAPYFLKDRRPRT